jgi:hypothetical protein
MTVGLRRKAIALGEEQPNREPDENSWAQVANASSGSGRDKKKRKLISSICGVCGECSQARHVSVMFVLISNHTVRKHIMCKT